LEKSSQTVWKKSQAVESFCAPVESIEKAVKAVGETVSYPLVSRWFLPV